ncbi:hypothetical protein [Candidatus Parabeggiatoa sp. HSG14]|nr:hypothetical protein [Thiotrichales bacterium HSG14]
MVETQYGQTWAKYLWLLIKNSIIEMKPHCNHLEPDKIANYENRYDEIVK